MKNPFRVAHYRRRGFTWRSSWRYAEQLRPAASRRIRLAVVVSAFGALLYSGNGTLAAADTEIDKAETEVLRWKRTAEHLEKQIVNCLNRYTLDIGGHIFDCERVKLIYTPKGAR